MAKTMRLTEKHKEILESGADGICIRGVWHWHVRGEAVTRQVNTLLKNGKMSAIYFSDGRAGASRTIE